MISPQSPICVMFDFDGVLVDSEVISLDELRASLAKFGVDLSLEETRDRFLGTSISEPIKYVEKITGQACETLLRNEMHERLFRRFKTELRTMPHVDDVLRGLAIQNIAFCIASSGSIERLAFAMATTGLDQFFPGTAFSGDMVSRSKPEPDLFLHAARSMGILPSQCVVVEDSPWGIIAAKRAGMRSIGFAGGSHLDGHRETHAQYLISLGAERVLYDHRDLDGFLDAFKKGRQTWSPAKGVWLTHTHDH